VRVIDDPLEQTGKWQDERAMTISYHVCEVMSRHRCRLVVFLSVRTKRRNGNSFSTVPGG